MKKLTALFITLFFLTLASLVPKETLAATLSLSPSSGTYSKGSTLKVNVYVNTGENVNAVQANISYPADKLQFTSVATGGSVLTIIAEKGGGGGFVKIGGGTPTPGFSGNKFIGAVNFTVLAEGSASLTFAGDSAIFRDSDNSNVYTGGSAGSYTLSGTSSAPVTTTGPQTAQQVKESLAISNLQVVDVAKSSAKFTWSTNIESSSIIEYGFSQNYEFTASNDALTKEHQITLDEGTLVPGTTYNFVVRSKDADGKEVSSSNQTFVTPGYLVVIRVKDSKGVLVSGATVTLYSEIKEALTDTNGEASFENISPGEHGLVIKSGDQVMASKVQVLESDNPQVFEESFELQKNLGGEWILYGVIAVGIIVLIVIILLIYLKAKNKKDTSGPATVINQPTDI